MTPLDWIIPQTAFLNSECSPFRCLPRNKDDPLSDPAHYQRGSVIGGELEAQGQAQQGGRWGRRSVDADRQEGHPSHQDAAPITTRSTPTLNRNGSSAARNDRIACSRSCGVSVAWASPPADRDPGSHLPWGSCVFAFVPCSSHPLADRPKHQYLRCSARTPAAQWISAFFTGLTWRDRVAKEGGCPNRLRITCGAGPLGAPSPLAGDTY